MTDFNADCRSTSAQHERPGGYVHAVVSDNALGQVTKTLMHAERILDDSEDSEELCRKIEAEESAQNIGALFGLAAGVALGIADAKKRAEQDQAEQRLSAEPQEIQQPMEQSM